MLCVFLKLDGFHATKVITVRETDATISPDRSIEPNLSTFSQTNDVINSVNNNNNNINNSKDNTVNMSMITINSDLPDLSNSLASNVSQVTVVTSHPPIIIDNSMPQIVQSTPIKAPIPPNGNEVYIVSNDSNKSHPLHESSTDDDYPSLDSLEAASKLSKQSRQSTIIIGDSMASSTLSPPSQSNRSNHVQQPRARKLDESEVFIVNNEGQAILSDLHSSTSPAPAPAAAPAAATAPTITAVRPDKSLDTSHVSVVTVGEEIRVKDSSHAKTPLRNSISSTNTSINDGVYTPDSFDSDSKQPNSVQYNNNRTKTNGQIPIARDQDDVNIIVNKKKTKPKISPDSSVGSMDSRTQSECGSMRSNVTPSPAIPIKPTDRSDAESTNSHDSCAEANDSAVIIRRPKAERTERSKEEIELRNLKKKTRKRTRKFEIDGVQVTTTTSKVIYGDEENGKMYDDHIFRKQELRELKMLQKQEKKQFLDLQIKEQASKEQQERRFDQERIALERTYEADMDALTRQHRQTIEKTEQQQEADLRAKSKKIRADQECELKLVCIYM